VLFNDHQADDNPALAARSGGCGRSTQCFLESHIIADEAVGISGEEGTQWKIRKFVQIDDMTNVTCWVIIMEAFIAFLDRNTPHAGLTSTTR